ncbi:hypothetical protein ACF09J_19950 [Streptomyces sp. NPDC014889]|uniref:hypothetical protein n=1 Tax=Streptomyces sp. NPDC014889 TaxID=3364928 RepID=UPI0036F64A9E
MLLIGVVSLFSDMTHEGARGVSGPMLAVPLLAVAGHWQAAAVLIVAERGGRAMRTPAHW